MEMFWWIIAILWIAGWLNLLAKINITIEKHNISIPCKEVKIALPFVLFVTWPYFYFYEKN